MTAVICKDAYAYVRWTRDNPTIKSRMVTDIADAMKLRSRGITIDGIVESGPLSGVQNLNDIRDILNSMRHPAVSQPHWMGEPSERFILRPYEVPVIIHKEPLLHQDLSRWEQFATDITVLNPVYPPKEEVARSESERRLLNSVRGMDDEFIDQLTEIAKNLKALHPRQKSDGEVMFSFSFKDLQKEYKRATMDIDFKFDPFQFGGELHHKQVLGFDPGAPEEDKTAIIVPEKKPLDFK